MSEAKKCPKCGGQTEVGHLNDAWKWMWGRSRMQLRVGPPIYSYACKNCGYVEFYIETKKQTLKTAATNNSRVLLNKFTHDCYLLREYRK